jgi:hypothetical protein
MNVTSLCRTKVNSCIPRAEDQQTRENCHNNNKQIDISDSHIHPLRTRNHVVEDDVAKRIHNDSDDWMIRRFLFERSGSPIAAVPVWKWNG